MIQKLLYDSDRSLAQTHENITEVSCTCGQTFYQVSLPLHRALDNVSYQRTLGNRQAIGRIKERCVCWALRFVDDSNLTLVLQRGAVFKECTTWNLFKYTSLVQLFELLFRFKCCHKICWINIDKSPIQIKTKCSAGYRSLKNSIERQYVGFESWYSARIVTITSLKNLQQLLFGT